MHVVAPSRPSRCRGHRVVVSSWRPSRPRVVVAVASSSRLSRPRVVRAARRWRHAGAHIATCAALAWARGGWGEGAGGRGETCERIGGSADARRHAVAPVASSWPSWRPSRRRVVVAVASSSRPSRPRVVRAACRWRHALPPVVSLRRRERGRVTVALRAWARVVLPPPCVPNAEQEIYKKNDSLSRLPWPWPLSSPSR